MVVEKALVTAFILPQRRSRYLSLLETQKGREKWRLQLAHFAHWDPRFQHPIEPSQSHADAIWKLLRGFGSPEMCYVFSEWDQLDAKEMGLGEALAACIGYGMGTVLSCIPGRLAFYEGEGPSDRFILRRRD